MRPATLATLQQLEDAEWFSAVGIHDEVADGMILLSSWDEAIEHCSSPVCGNLRLEIANRLCERVLAASPERFNRWNDIVDEVKTRTIPLVRARIAPVVAEFQLPKVFGDDVDWDILHVCMEAEFADLCPPGFYAGIAFWYVRGHFPCGWRGPVKGGRPIIY